MAIKKAPKLTTLKTTAVEPKYNSEAQRKFDPRPTISISEDDLPEIKKWTIDGKYKLLVEVEMRGISERDYGHLKDKKVAELKITKIGTANE